MRRTILRRLLRLRLQRRGALGTRSVAAPAAAAAPAAIAPAAFARLLLLLLLRLAGLRGLLLLLLLFARLARLALIALAALLRRLRALWFAVALPPRLAALPPLLRRLRTLPRRGALFAALLSGALLELLNLAIHELLLLRFVARARLVMTAIRAASPPLGICSIAVLAEDAFRKRHTPVR